VFVHLDLDVLDPSELPAAFPVSGGLTWACLGDLLAEVSGRCELVGAEVTGAAPGHAERIAATLARLS
jgi:arginase family enzyme